MKKKTQKLPASVLVRNQKIEKRYDAYDENGHPVVLIVEIRHDDECGNGHNSFAITGDLYDRNYRIPQEPSTTHKNGTRLWLGSCGCLHDEIAKYAPDLAPFIKWHLTSTDDPMHYIANTMYHATDKDHNGRRKGEPITRTETRIKFGDFPITFQYSEKFIKFLKEAENFDFEVLPIEHENKPGETYKFKPKYTLGNYADKWHECPFDTESDALEFLAALQRYKVTFPEIKIIQGYSEGKEANLEAARSCAVWPDATAEQLQDKAALEARLPALMAAFKADVESLGLVY